MILFKNLKERVRLLEYENEILARKVKALEEHIKDFKAQPQPPHPRMIREDGWDLSYKTLRKKHRKHDVKFDDGL
jgi:hypothetical protein